MGEDSDVLLPPCGTAVPDRTSSPTGEAAKDSEGGRDRTWPGIPPCLCDAAVPFSSNTTEMPVRTPALP